MKTTTFLAKLILLLITTHICYAQNRVFEGQGQDAKMLDFSKRKAFKELKGDLKRSKDDFIVSNSEEGSILLKPQRIKIENAAPFLAAYTIWKGEGLDHTTFTLEYRTGANRKSLSEWKQVVFDGHDNQTSNRMVSKMLFLDVETQFIQYKLSFKDKHSRFSFQSVELHYYSPGKTPEKEKEFIKSQSQSLANSRACNLPPVVSRSQWGAIFRNPASSSSVSHLIVHHEAGSNTSSDWAARVRSIQSFHINGNGWSDIGYNFLVDPNGVIYEGRAGGDSAVGAHFCGFNRNTMAVCMLGNYSSVSPTVPAQNGLKDILAYKADKENINPLSASFHYSGRTLNHISGHRDANCSACPGNGMYNLLGSIRSDVNNLISNGCSSDGDGGDVSDNEAPTTSMSVVGGTNQSGDFQVLFEDDDNVGVTRTYYQVLEKYGTDWLANRNNGFFNDNFNTFYGGYVVGSGDWSIQSGRMLQNNTSINNTALNSYLVQNSGLPYMYEFSAKLRSTSGPRKFGMHIMASSQTQSQRGNSYLVWFSGEDNKVRIYETIGNVLNFRAIADVSLDNQWAKYRITYSPAFGVLQVFKNNTKLLEWTDSSPLSSGSSISLRTNQTQIEFDDLKVYKFRLNDQITVTAGTSSNDDVRTSSCKVKSMVRDEAGNWSLLGNLDINLINLRVLSKESNEQIELSQKINIYPNAITDKCMISFETVTKTTFGAKLYNLSGQEIASFNIIEINPGKHTEDVSNLFKQVDKGVYILKTFIDNTIFTNRIIKQ